jgi:putative ABC transport system substrate-binding protein
MSGLAADVVPKRFQLLNELVPGNRLVAVLCNPSTPYTAVALEQVRTAAPALGLPFKVFEARTVEEVPDAIDQAVKAGAASMLMLEDPVLIGAMQKIIKLVAEARLPTIAGPRDFATAGGLIAYGSDYRELSRKAADHVDKILKGASPANLPVEQATKLELVINLKSARELGLAIPAIVLARADEVIE